MSSGNNTEKARRIGLDGNTGDGHVKREKMSYKVKLVIFFVLFIIVLMTYIFSFINGTSIGLTMEDISLSFLGAITGAISSVLSATNIGILTLLGEGIARFFAIGPVAVIACGILISTLIVGIVASVVSARYTWRKKQSVERKFLSANAGEAGIR